ncbi:hypothetical protein [Novosphingobium beihaiensis]|uniref:Uncharacterized protein n=1 Tax=Novosphingobium beihaiensis TaxID=2930389 RepID=A0ABT0BTB3_9SPHN|nr:hypothetical protein [Novosphingobium beihaiensis]MCJ2188041.1 hypothetical protein [Novosphingobium beihaiensis]
MPETTTLKLTVYKPEIMADPGGQTGFEYDLTIVAPDGRVSLQGDAGNATAARCDVVPVAGTLSFPNPAAPVVSPYTGLMFIYDNSPAIAFPLSLIANSTGDALPFSMNLAFPASPLYWYSGAIMFGAWPGPLSETTASFLSPQT